MALQDVRQLQHGAAELFKDIAGFVGQADLDEHQQPALEMLRVQPRGVAHDDALALQSAHSLGAGRGGQADAFAQFCKRHTAFCLKQAKDLAVDLVQLTAGLMLGSHRIIASIKSGLGVN